MPVTFEATISTLESVPANSADGWNYMKLSLTIFTMLDVCKCDSMNSDEPDVAVTIPFKQLSSL